MKTIIFAGLRNPIRDQAIAEALLDKSVAELAKELKLTPSTVRAAAKRIAAMNTYRLALIGGGGKDIPIGQVFQACSPRRVPTFFRNIQEPRAAQLGDH